MRFKNPAASEIVEIRHPAAAVLVLGPIYFFYRKIWIHGLVSLALMIATWGFSNVIYAYYATDIIIQHYRKMGWERLGITETNINSISKQ